jgi:hypothetical protein
MSRKRTTIPCDNDVMFDASTKRSENFILVGNSLSNFESVEVEFIVTNLQDSLIDQIDLQ